MAATPESVSMALFCDFENVALGVRDANYDKFDIKPVLERLLLKGSIVVKKAYCDWERYKGFKATMHEANFELIEIPHVRQSGKNSADIRLVVDALDLCYTKSHVNTFVIISGDSDFSPLVSKLRENAKQVIGVGVKQSTSDLLIANCDEFIFYDDLVRESQRAARRDLREGQTPAPRRSPEEEKRRKDEIEARKLKALELAVGTFEALVAERGDTGKIWASVLKEAIKRRKPDFNESYYGFRAFGNLLEEAQSRGLLEVGRDEKSGTYVQRGSRGSAAVSVGEAPGDRPAAATMAAPPELAADSEAPVATTVLHPGDDAAVVSGRQRGQRRTPYGLRRGASDSGPAAPVPETNVEAEPAAEPPAAVAVDLPAAASLEPGGDKPEPRRRGRGSRKPASQASAAGELPAPADAADAAAAAPEHAEQALPMAEVVPATPARKAGSRGRRPRKASPASDAS